MFLFGMAFLIVGLPLAIAGFYLSRPNPDEPAAD
jgi:hypothetical protein